jgi:hypothetical protein
MKTPLTPKAMLLLGWPNAVLCTFGAIVTGTALTMSIFNT